MKTVQADLVKDDILHRLEISSVDAVYSDPPWGPGNLMYWRTHNGERQRPDWSLFRERFCELCARACPSGPVWVEMGLRWESQFVAAMDAVGLPLVGSWRCHYGAGSKRLENVLMLFGDVPPPQTEIPFAERTRIPLVRWALSAHDGTRTVLDPCCGLGTTARACLRLGLDFYGAELNAARLERTRKILARGRG